MENKFEIINADCLDWLQKNNEKIDLTFLDPPFNQGKDYKYFNDSIPDDKYWSWMKQILSFIYKMSSNGSSIYFIQREKNTENVLTVMREAGWTFQNLIIWKKKTSAVPCSNKFGKQYQIIAYSIKGDRPKVFNKLRISPPLPQGYKYERENGIFVTDIWDDIRELTSGYFAGDEALRNENGDRFHKQQSPLSLLLRIILSSTKIGDFVFDPFAGTGTTLTVAYQLGRKSLGIEIDPNNVLCIKERLRNLRKSDLIDKYYKDYIYTENLKEIWDSKYFYQETKSKELSLFG